MDVLLRIVAIIIEVLVLAVVAFAVLKGVRLAVFDLGIGPKYSRMVTLALLAVGFIVLIFFVAHLTTFYPEI